MNSTLPYFAVFYAIGIVIFGLFVRVWLRKKRIRDEERKGGLPRDVPKGDGVEKTGRRGNSSESG